MVPKELKGSEKNVLQGKKEIQQEQGYNKNAIEDLLIHNDSISPLKMVLKKK